MGIEDRLIEDVGLRRGVSKLTPEQIEKTVNSVIRGETGARLKAYAETCMRCGLCAEACHFSQSHGDPSYTPAARCTRPWACS
jgi:ferredoxin